MRVTIDVKKAYIKRGVPFDNDFCPVALGFNRVLKKNMYAGVGSQSVSFYNRYTLERAGGAELPSRVQEFIDNFDVDNTREKAKTFTFTIRMPKRFLRKSVVDASNE